MSEYCVRQERSRPIAEDIFAWIDTTIPKLLVHSDLPAAMRYALARREMLLRYLDDGCLAIDNKAPNGPRAVLPAAEELSHRWIARRRHACSPPYAR